MHCIIKSIAMIICILSYMKKTRKFRMMGEDEFEMDQLLTLLNTNSKIEMLLNRSNSSEP